jgi:hypothetical protein
MPNINLESIGLVVGAGLTLLIFSYVLGDNPLYRLALHLFIGALVGYSLGIVLRDTIGEAFKTARDQWLSNPIVLVPLVLGVLLIFKISPRLAFVGNLSVAYLVGVGTAVALSGALLGTLVPQIGATTRALSFEPLNLLFLDDWWFLVRGLLIVFGTVCALMAFNFSAGKQRGLAGTWSQIIGAMAWVGRVFLIFAVGVAFAGALTASLSIFIGRIQYIMQAFSGG